MTTVSNYFILLMVNDQKQSCWSDFNELLIYKLESNSISLTPSLIQHTKTFDELIY